ncbi:MAG: phosphoserine transaminase [Parvularculales bacterium]
MTIDKRTIPKRPYKRPYSAFFSSGPCAKRPGWDVTVLKDACLGRSHRSGVGKAKLAIAIDKTRHLLEVPEDYRIAIVPASDTGAVEMALWSLLGVRGVDVLVWESFGASWASDITSQLCLEDVRVLKAPYGELPDLTAVDFNRDVVFTWNGTTSGVRVPNGDWISDTREGLVICDATSAVFAQNLPWRKLDVVTFSWQKVLGGEAAHGMVILSPQAVARLETYTPPWPMPKIFRMAKYGKLIEGLFRGETINTPSMLCVEDYLDALHWVEAIGGVAATCARADANYALIAEWVAETPWIAFSNDDLSIGSNTSVCLKIVDINFTALEETKQRALLKEMAEILEGEDVAYDIDGYREAPPGLRLWIGATVQADDVRAVLLWISWAYKKVLVARL